MLEDSTATEKGCITDEDIKKRTCCINSLPHNFNDPEEEGFGKHSGKRKKKKQQHFLLFPQCFLLYYREKSFKQCLIFCLQKLSIWSHPKFVRFVFTKQQKFGNGQIESTCRQQVKCC